MKIYKNRKQFIEDLINLSSIEIYEHVLNKKYIKYFPKGFWQKPEALQNAKEVVQYLIEKKLKWDDEDIKEKLDIEIFKINKLRGMTDALFNDSPYEAIDNAYPNKFKPWELKKVYKKFWNLETAKEATIWLIKDKLKWDDEDVRNKLNAKTFINNGLSGMISILFNDSPYRAINNAYPNKFKPWEFNYVSVNFWNLKTAKEATIWLIEKKLKWDDEDVRNKLNTKTFINNGLSGMTHALFDNSPYRAINNAYPNKFKPWEFNYVSVNFWNLKTAKEATIWLIEKKLKWDDEDVKEKLNYQIFKINGLSGMISILFDNSPYRAINNAYPNKFKPWEFNYVSVNFWNLETAKEATIWLIKDKLKWDDKDIKEKLNYQIFKINGLSGMISILFNDSPYKAIDNAYPNKFKPWEFNYVSVNFWNLETAREATIWLIEKKLKWDDENVRNKLNYQLFVDNGLSGMTNILFDNSPYRAINNAYPDKFKPWEFKNYRFYKNKSKE